nr:PREDICTED: TBC1 domain family member 16 [Bemisia tabaci]
MPLIDIFKRASKLVLNLQHADAVTSYEEGEVVFCKNNVCVHPPTILRQETEIIHHPGYLTISCQRINKYSELDNCNDTTLILTWIPNATLRKCPSSVEKLSAKGRKEQGSKISASPKFDSLSPNRKNSVQSVSSYDSHESALSYSPSFECRDILRTKNSVTSSRSHLSEHYDGVSVGSIQESLKSNFSDKYSLQVDLVDNDEICRITMEEASFTPTNCKENPQTDDMCSKKMFSTSSANEDSNPKDFDESVSRYSGGKGNIASQIISCANHYNDSCNVQESSSLNEVENTASKFRKNSLKNFSVAVDQSESSTKMNAINSGITTLSIVKDVSCCTKASTDLDQECKCEGSHVCSTKEVADSAREELSTISEDSLLNLDSSHKKLDKPEFSGAPLCNKDGAKVSSSLLLESNVSSGNDKSGLISLDDSNKDVTSIKNSPSKSSAFSFSSSSDFTNATSIDSTNDSAEKEVSPPKSPSDCSDSNSCESSAPLWTYSSEYLNRRRYLPESNSASPATIRQIQRSCQKFSVDLGEMRSLRLFFSNGDTSSGQLVIASRESQYKILHFHHGGLDRLAQILQEWNRLSNFDPSSVNSSEDVPYRHFMICRPEVNKDDLHPEEGKVPILTEELWCNLLNEVGQLEDPLFLRKSVFFNGLPQNLRRTVWPFLLQIYPYSSTFADRETIVQIRKLEYQEIIHRRSKLSGVNKENFMRNVQSVIEKDVVRTDRNNPFYAGDTNPNLETMKNILLNYAVYDSSLGYLQGMSDLLAPLLAEIRDESESFWCFCGLMQRRLFVCTPTDADMEKNLRHLRELIRIMVPAFYSHLLKHEDAMELLFCHRWILLCFKREFPESIVFQIWEACWSNYLIDYFHLFICLAIVAAYSPDVIAQDLRTDEMLLHFSSLSMYMDGVLILKKARWLLYRFRQLLVIPCSLAMLCQYSGPGMWDNSHTPSVKCLDDPTYCPETPCPYRGCFGPDS